MAYSVLGFVRVAEKELLRFSGEGQGGGLLAGMKSYQGSEQG